MHMRLKAFEKDINACGLCGIIHEEGFPINGETALRFISAMNERGNRLGAGFAGYGIYPEYRSYYALHVMYYHRRSKEEVEQLIDKNFKVEVSEKIPTKSVASISNPPDLWRYFVKPKNCLEVMEDELVVKFVIHVNAFIDGAFIMSSGKNMGVFKAVGSPRDVGEFYRIDEYEGYMWLAHTRFPTNTPGWWGGAHPFNLLDLSVVHNGELSSYGTNKRYVETFGYKCSLLTDSEVLVYLTDLLMRRHKLPIQIAALALAPPFWEQISQLPVRERELLKAIRLTYGSALANGPFAIILGFNGRMIGLSDRIKLRPLVAARKNQTLYLASEEAAIREICEKPEEIWHPAAGEPVIGRLRRDLNVELYSARIRYQMEC